MVKDNPTFTFENVQIWVGPNIFTPGIDLSLQGVLCAEYVDNTQDKVAWIFCDTPVSGNDLFIVRKGEQLELGIAEIDVFVE